MKKLLVSLMLLPITSFAHDTGFIHSHTTGPMSFSTIALAALLFCFLYKKL
ncbi:MULTISPECIES: hypothetical protein [Vibrio]|uniref:Uncharacterized protein n=1 Tax=Vibrio halioticoli NBRC 102217 TaxID=1219072 RepID=V5F382_9VIBR|nr:MULTISPECIES: hypothetical protein [Vibrio]GAD89619.1 hypothetical protein VHA01S_024_00130 [Vibrio halioticoli NBRC 102217]